MLLISRHFSSFCICFIQKMMSEGAEESNNIRQFWTEHRITLIAYETQYVYQTKPSNSLKDSKKQGQIDNSNKLKKKEIQFQGGFLFPGRTEQRQSQINVLKEIEQSQCRHLKQLFEEYSLAENLMEVRQFIKIMLELKHSDIFHEFMDLYDFIWRQIKDVQFDQLKAEVKRANQVDRVTEKVSKFVEKTSQFKLLKSYMQENKKETIKLFKVTVYCFLAEKFNFNINQYYAQAFEIVQQDKKIPAKKRKLQ